MLLSKPFITWIANLTFAACFYMSGLTAWADSLGDSVNADDYFAVVNGQRIEAADYIYRFRKALREKFFHGRVSDEELEAFKQQVADQLVLEVLLEQEARKRGLKPDADQVKKKLDDLDKKFTESESKEEREGWEQSRETVLAVMKTRVEREMLVAQLKEVVNHVSPPSKSEVQRYYEENQNKFTEPPRWDVSIILLSVDPSSSPEVWDETVEKAESLLKKIRKGESFEELARIHSGDETAPEGGHMGYIHLGMLGTPAQKVLNVMAPGEISEPVVLLEGVAIFKLNAVKEEDLNTLEDVEERARNLLMRESGQKAWKDLETQLHASASIQYSDLLKKL